MRGDVRGDASVLYPESHEKSTGTAWGHVPVYLLQRRRHELRVTHSTVEQNAPKMITATSTLQSTPSS